jgi:dipeptidyl-peptidase-3
LNFSPFRGFVNPVYTTETDSKGDVTNVLINYDEDYVQQNLRYSRESEN